jgi:branched-chain amino acid transport system substrate-binding protein
MSSMVLPAVLAMLLLGVTPLTSGEGPAPVYVGLDAEFGLKNSTSAQAIERGILVAMDEINRAGGVLGGRPLKLISRDNRSITARGIANVREFALIPDLVAFYVGRFSPVALEYVDLVHELELILLDPWAAADAITDNGYHPNYAFRLSLRDSLAIPAMFRRARETGIERVGLLLPNTSWGRSNLAAANTYYLRNSIPESVAIAWYSWGDQTMLGKYQSLKAAGAQAIVFVANDTEAVVLCNELAQLPKTERLPIISHWGVTGGQFATLLGERIAQIDFTVVQTFSFYSAESDMTARFLATAEELFGLSRIEDIESPVGVGHAYDLTHILARAIDRAGTTSPPAVRNALEQVRDYRGLVKNFARPFTPENHDALGAEDVFMAKYRGDGTIVPVDVPRR